MRLLPSINATISSKQRLIEIIFMKEEDNKLLPAKFNAMIECLCTFYESLTLISSALCFTSTRIVKKRIFQTGTCKKMLLYNETRQNTTNTLLRSDIPSEVQSRIPSLNSNTFSKKTCQV